VSRETEPIERRWRESRGDATDDRIGGMLRQVADPPPLAEPRLDRIAAALQASAAPRRRRLPLLRWAVVALVLGTGGAVFARHELARLWTGATGKVVETPKPRPVIAKPDRPRAPLPETAVPPAPEAAPLPPPPSSPAPSAAWGRFGGGRRSSQIATADHPASPPPRLPPREAPAPIPAAPTEPTPVPPSPTDEMLAPVPVWSRPPPPAAPAPLVAPAPPGLGDEARLLRQALQELRHEHDPLAALSSLDQHRTRFPAGVLRADADVLRVEVLLALRRDGQALAVLEHLDFSATPRGDELRVTRGELRAQRDCPRALEDFDQVLGGAPAAAVAERALRGRAVCPLRTGDQGAAQAALRAYLERFPQGPFAAEARRHLQAPR
jgi:hypothetical protein